MGLQSQSKELDIEFSIGPGNQRKLAIEMASYLLFQTDVLAFEYLPDEKRTKFFYDLIEGVCTSMHKAIYFTEFPDRQNKGDYDENDLAEFKKEFSELLKLRLVEYTKDTKRSKGYTHSRRIWPKRH